EEEIKAYLKERKNLYKNKKFSLKTPLFPDIEKLKKLYSLLEKASEKTTGVYKINVLKAKAGIDFLILMEKEKFEKEFIEKVFDEFKRLSYVFKITNYSESGNINDILKLGYIPKNDEPEEVKGLEKNKDWFDFQEILLKLCCASIVKDIQASNGAAVYMEGWKTDWGIQLNLGDLPEGSWDIFFVIKVKAKDKRGIAFRYGVYPVTKTFEAFLEDFSDEKYHTVYVGRFENDSTKHLWIAPPGNENVKGIYVDRIFIIKARN
ncbi:MAG: hypothetical protein GXO21_02600, partial [Aquificae bacterium]|nr:hypothetical protein [Aquificota bacterium]